MSNIIPPCSNVPAWLWSHTNIIPPCNNVLRQEAHWKKIFALLILSMLYALVPVTNLLPQLQKHHFRRLSESEFGLLEYFSFASEHTKYLSLEGARNSLQEVVLRFLVPLCWVGGLLQLGGLSPTSGSCSTGGFSSAQLLEYVVASSRQQ